MPKFQTAPAAVPAPVTGITRVAIVIDESGSMGHIQNEVVKSFNRQLEEIQRRAKETHQKTYLSLYTFSYKSDIELHVDALPVEMVLPWRVSSYTPRGSTALVSATGRAIQDLRIQDQNRPEDANLLIVITDGEENASEWQEKQQVPQEIRRLQASDRWTFVFIGPPGCARELGMYFGVLPGNVLEWEGTKQGVENYTVSTQSALNTYYQARATGQTMTTRFFQPNLSTVSETQASRALKNVTMDYKVIQVERETDIQSLVRAKTGGYIPGSGFYELTKKEKIQPGKLMLLMERNSGRIYGGEVRKFLGCPSGREVPEGIEVRVAPGNHGDFRIFVRSDSVNRKLVRGTSILVLR